MTSRDLDILFGRVLESRGYTNVIRPEPTNHTNRFQGGNTMNNSTRNIVNVGDVFHSQDPTTSFSKLEVLANLGWDQYGPYRCLGTKRSGSTTVVNSVRRLTLLSYRYGRKPTADFNLDTAAYQRPMATSTRPALDQPASPTNLIRCTRTLEQFIKTDTATLLHFNATGAKQAKTVSAKIEMLLGATDGYMVLAVPGKYSQDVFYVDNRDQALTMLGLVKHAAKPIQVRQAVDGSEWVAA